MKWIREFVDSTSLRLKHIIHRWGTQLALILDKQRLLEKQVCLFACSRSWPRGQTYADAKDLFGKDAEDLLLCPCVKDSRDRGKRLYCSAWPSASRELNLELNRPIESSSFESRDRNVRMQKTGFSASSMHVRSFRPICSSHLASCAHSSRYLDR